jgi:peptide/nickel transport system permease protein
LGGTVLGVIAGCVLIIPLAVPMDPDAADPASLLQPPSRVHPMGTDLYGRDVLVRVVYGARIALGIGIGVSVGTLLLGMPVGMMAAYVRRTDGLIMRAVDALMSLPPVLMAIAFMAVLGAGLTNVVVVLLLAWTPLTIRVARAATMALLSQEYIEAAIALGGTLPRVLYQHIMRNAVDAVLVQQTVVFVGAILGEATFSFIGAGLQPPAASLGTMLGETQAVVVQAPWLAAFPGSMLVVIALAAVLVGDGLRDRGAVDRG